MILVLKRLLIAGLLLLSSVPAFATDPEHFIVFGMSQEQLIANYGRIPWMNMPGKEMDLLGDNPFNGDSLRMLAVLVEWDDRPGTLPWQTFDSLLFSRDVIDEGSLADYIHEVSYGQVKLTGDVIDWFNAGTYDKQFPLSSLFELLDPIVDYSLYDGDVDNKVDAICFIRSGTGEEDSQNPVDIWSYASVSDQGWGRYDDVKIAAWNTCPEFKPLRDQFNPMQFSGEVTRSGIRVFVHELGHNLGLPDLYDYDEKLNTSTYDTPNDDNDHPLVDWDPMGYYGYGYFSIGMMGANHYSAWSKVLLNFVEPTVLVGEYNDLIVYNVETRADSSIYKIPINDSDTEYFLLEYRNPNSTGKFDKFDSDFSCWFWPNLKFGYDAIDRGLLITHVDDAAAPSTEWITMNRGTPLYEHYSVCVEDAGYNPSKPATYNPEGNVTDSAQWWYPWETKKGALFSDDVIGQSLFGPNTIPSSDGYGGYSGVYVRVDSTVDDKMYIYVNTSVEYLECCENRGDADGSGQVDALDLDYLVNYLYRGGAEPVCYEEADADETGQVDILDLEYMIAYLFTGGPEPGACPIGGVAPSFTSTPDLSAVYGVAYSYDANASGDPAPTYSLSISPGDMSVDALTGLVEWVPDDIGDFNVAIDATNSWGDDQQLYVLSVSGVAPSFTSTPPLTAVDGMPYSYDVETDGYPAASYALTTYPTGMTIDPVSGLIEWTPAAFGDYDVVVEATNSEGMTPQSFSISVSDAIAPVITTTPPVGDVTVNTSYSYDADATGNPVPTYALTVYPAGMTIDAVTGEIAWTPTETGDFSVTVSAGNGVDPIAEQPFTITVVPTTSPPLITSTAVTVGTVGQLYSYDVEATGYPAPTFLLATAPSGLTINAATGLMEWTPSEAGDFDVRVEAANGFNPDAVQVFTISVSPAPEAPIIITTAVTSGLVGYLYSYDVDASGYPTPTYALTTFPTGMTIDAGTGLIQWTPDASGDFDVVVEATNSEGTDPQNFTISVSDAVVPVITSTALTSGTVGSLYSYDVEATGNPSPAFSLTTYPSGMSIDVATGLISWTPGSVGDFDVVVEAANIAGSDIQSFTISVSGIVPTFTSTPITTGTYDIQYEYTAAADGQPDPTFALTTYPAGMTINSGTGVIRWTPDDAGDFDVVVEATNSAGSATQPYTITVSGVAPVFTSTPVTTGTYGQLYSYDANSSGYPAATYSLTTFPTGMTIDAVTGLIEWTPDDIGDYDVVVEADNGYGTDIQSFTISVGGTVPSFTTSPVTGATISELYSYDADADGYPAPTFALTTLPTGMTIDAASGLIEWTPDALGDYDVVVEAANSAGTTPQSFTISVVAAPEAPVITSTPITAAVVETPYTYDVEATGVPAPTYSLTTAPTKMSIDAGTGLIEWTPDFTVGDYDVVVEATNAYGTDIQSFTITVSGTPPTITSTPITTATYDVQYEYQATRDGTPTPVFSFTTAPEGMTVNELTGIIRWTPDDVGDYDVVLVATNIEGTDTQSFTISVSGIAPTVTTTAITTATYGQPYSYDVDADAYPAASFALTTFPTGMTIDGVTGVISWTPDDVGDYDVVVEATNAYGTDIHSFTISVAGTVPVLTSTPVTSVLYGQAYSYDVDADGYPAPAYALTTYPTGMSIDGVTGVISWTPDNDGDFDVVVEASNSAGTTPQSFTITVGTAPSITSTAITAAICGQPYSYDVEADGHPASTFTLTTYPSGMTIDAVTGLIEWTPDGDGAYDVVVEITNGYGSDSQPFTINVSGVAPTITSTAVTTGTFGQAYSYDVDDDGCPAATYSLTTFPTGMTIDGVTGVISWTPADVGDYDVVVEVTNTYGTDTQPFTITVAGIAPTVTSTAITTGTVSVLYTYDVDADGYPAATYSLTTFPTGMTIDGATGVISWTPGLTGDYDVVVEATNAYGSDTQPFTITVQ